MAAIYWTGIYLYDAGTLDELQFVASYGEKHKLAASPDGKYLAVATPNEVQLWDVQTGQAVHTLEGGEDVTRFAFSPDGRALAGGCSGRDCAVRLWDVSSGEIRHTLEGHTKDVGGVVFSPDGRLLASSDWDGITRLWDVAGGQEVQVLEQEWSVHSVTFSPDGSRLATGSFDGIVRLWGVGPSE